MRTVAETRQQRTLRIDYTADDGTVWRLEIACEEILFEVPWQVCMHVHDARHYKLA
ncbi:MAG: hypothetical protein U5K38_18305 [Woeseiaceae bacterium]|nr:hypothetical protein [Woeseiaceae bacterium]